MVTGFSQRYRSPQLWEYDEGYIPFSGRADRLAGIRVLSTGEQMTRRISKSTTANLGFRLWKAKMVSFALIGATAVQASLGASAAQVRTNLLLGETRFATEAYFHDSGKPGPTVMIVGGVHGNEPAGAAAAEIIRHWPLRNGKLVVIPRANVPALAAGKRLTPNLGTNLSNLNRNYPRAGKSESPRGELAAVIWQIALDSKPDWLLDLHEGFDFNQLNDKSVGSSVIAFPLPKCTAAADLMRDAVNAAITNAELKFVRRDLPIDGSLARAGGEHLKIPSMTVETTSKQPMAKRVRQHEIMVHRLLAHLGMIDSAIPAESYVEVAAPVRTAVNASRALLRVALYKGPGTGGEGPPNLMKRLNNAPASSIKQVTPEEIRSGVLTNYDVVVFGGGSGSKQAEALGESGRTEVKKFVGNGGGYIGICAGAYLATSGYPWSLGLVNARTVSPKWRRGTGDVKLELTQTGTQILGSREGQFNCRYANGPIVTPDDEPDLPTFTTLAFFRSELAQNDSPVGVMVNSPAIFSATFQKGRVVCVSPHPEQTKGLEEIVPQAINWVLAKSRSETNSPKAE